MSIELIVDNSQALDAGVDPQEMESLRDGFDEWMDEQGEIEGAFQGTEDMTTMSEERIVELQQQARALNQLFVDRITERRDRLNELLIQELGHCD